ncbi:dual specificity protein phosphatase family protein [Lignipirellula cremea]|uniref:Dual specificity phosphatase, catalytic domain n=1 Tax=Lignipirellula cremea TaxID=2528010 RepID=A0A518E1P6_9BACT|nr:dual specificity protein phosphatase [Lignipirellula cremea]QDU97993.1 Dual specificity phosphatase, catalytic domain [Lignipirellula cremea]
MWAVTTNLLIGTDGDARDRTSLIDNGVAHIVNCAVELESYFPKRFSYTRLDLKDPDENFHKIIDSTAGIIAKKRESGRVLVHCHGALSRSPAVVLAYLCSTGCSLIQSAETLSKALPTRPNSIFLTQLLDRFPIDTQDEPVSTLYAILSAQG